MHETSNQHARRSNHSSADTTESEVAKRQIEERRKLQLKLFEANPRGTSVEEATELTFVAKQLLELEQDPEQYFSFQDAKRLYEQMTGEAGGALSHEVFTQLCRALASKPEGIEQIRADFSEFSYERQMAAITGLAGAEAALPFLESLVRFDQYSEVPLELIKALSKTKGGGPALSFCYAVAPGLRDFIINEAPAAEESADFLFRHLESNNAESSRLAAEKLQRTSSQTENLITLLKETDSPWIQRLASVALTGNERAAAPLIELLKDRNSRELHMPVAAALRGQEKAAEILCELLGNKAERVEVRREAANSLAGITQATATLIECLDDKSPEVAISAAGALAGEPSACSTLYSAWLETGQRFRGLTHREQVSRFQAALIDGLGGFPPAVPDLIETLSNESNTARVRVAAAIALEGENSAQNALEDVLRVGRGELAAVAAKSLASIEGSGPALLDALFAKDSLVRFHAAKSLNRRDDMTEQLIEEFIQGRGRHNPASQQSILLALRGKPAGIELSVASLKAMARKVREVALDSLEHEQALGSLLWQVFKRY